MFAEREAVKIDPLRVVEAVTAGVAFLAAGVVIFTRGEVHGLTTGAGMWLAGAIGLACGLGLWQIAAFATLMALFVLGLLHTWSTGSSSTTRSKPGRAVPSASRRHGRRRARPLAAATGYADPIAAPPKHWYEQRHGRAVRRSGLQSVRAAGPQAPAGAVLRARLRRADLPTVAEPCGRGPALPDFSSFQIQSTD